MSLILVTGGAGFIGSHTVDLLLSQGYRVRVLDNFSNGLINNLPDEQKALEIIEGDICNISDVQFAMKGVDYCIHLAAQVSVVKSIEETSYSANQNILGFINILDAVRRNNVARLIYASSAAVYGIPTKLPLTEDTLLAPVSPYGLEKKVDEHYAELYLKLHRVAACGLRYFNVYGPRQDPNSPYAGVISIFIENLKRKKDLKIYGDGLQTRDFIFVSDVARVNLAAIKSNFTGVCNIATGKAVTILDLIEILETKSDCSVKKIFEPKRDGEIQNSSACIKLLSSKLGIEAQVNLQEGLEALLSLNS